jgi:anaerobic selenocysteine-containing dehydrogenase
MHRRGAISVLAGLLGAAGLAASAGAGSSPRQADEADAIAVVAPSGDLALLPSQPVLAVSCPTACRITASTSVGRLAQAAGTRSATLTAGPEAPRTLTLRLTVAERRALRRRGGANAVLRVLVEPDAGAPFRDRIVLRLAP